MNAPPGRAVEAEASANQRLILVIVILATGAAPLALNMPLPSMPGISREMDVGYGVVQLLLTLYLAAFAIAQLVYGPLSDRYGRRPVMIAGVVTFIAGSVGCALAPTIETLLLFRVIQGAGGCAGMVLGRAILRDLFDRARAASMLGYVTMAMVTAPMVAPAIGGVLDEVVGWRASFWLLSAIGCALLALIVLRLPETHPSPSLAGGAVALVRAARTLLSLPPFLANAAVMSFSSAMFFSFLAGAPFIVVALMGRSPAEYGFWFIINAISFMTGNFISARLVERVGIFRLIRIGAFGAIAGMAVLVGALTWGPFVPAMLFLPMTLITFSNGLVMPNAVAAAVSVRPDLAGAGAGLSGSMQMGLAAVLTGVIASIQNDSPAPMLAVMSICAVLAALAYLAARKYDRGE